MATSGTTTFNYTVGDLISDALKKCGVGLNGEVATAQETSDALNALEQILKAASKRGLKLWLRKTATITLVASTNSYSLGPSGTVVMNRPEEVVAAYLRDSNNSDVPLKKDSRDEYLSIPNKQATGNPIQFYYDPQTTNGVLYVYLTPSASVASSYSLIIDYKKAIDDASATTYDLEIPQEWYLPLKWILTDEIMMDYDIPEENQNRIERKASRYRKEVMDTDMEPGTSVYIRPRRRGRR